MREKGHFVRDLKVEIAAELALGDGHVRVVVTAPHEEGSTYIKAQGPCVPQSGFHPVL